MFADVDPVGVIIRIGTVFPQLTFTLQMLLDMTNMCYDYLFSLQRCLNGFLCEALQRCNWLLPW